MRWEALDERWDRDVSGRPSFLADLTLLAESTAETRPAPDDDEPAFWACPPSCDPAVARASGSERPVPGLAAHVLDPAVRTGVAAHPRLRL